MRVTPTTESTTPDPTARERLVPLVKRVVHEIGDDDVMGQAAKLAYFAFLALPPSLMAIFGIAGLFGSGRLAEWLLSRARMAMPDAVVESIMGPFIQEVVLENAPGPLSLGLILALVSGSTMFAGLMDSLNRAFDLEESRSFIRKRLVALAVMAVGVVFFLLAAGALLLGPKIPPALGLGVFGRTVWNIIHWPLAFGFIVATLFLAYYVLPNRDQKENTRALLIAAAVAAALWLLATAAFRVYISNFSSYSQTYGFLGAFIILLLWLYVTGVVVLVGGELASEMQIEP